MCTKRARIKYWYLGKELKVELAPGPRFKQRENIVRAALRRFVNRCKKLQHRCGDKSAASFRDRQWLGKSGKHLRRLGGVAVGSHNSSRKQKTKALVRWTPGLSNQSVRELERFIILRQQRSKIAPCRQRLIETQQESTLLDKYHFCEPVPQNDGRSRHWLQAAPRNNNGTALATAILHVQLPRTQVFDHLLRAVYGKTKADPAAIAGLTVRQVLACLQRAKKSWEEYHRVNLFSEWPYRSLQGPLSRLLLLASLIIHLRDDATACWEHLWRVREQALEKGYIAEQINEAVLYALITRGWPACKMWSAYLALSRLYDLHQSRAPYDPTKHIFWGPCRSGPAHGLWKHA